MLQEVRSAPPVPRDGRAPEFAMWLVVGVFLNDMLTSLSGVLVLMGVLAVHELGHFLAMTAFRYRSAEVFFVPLPSNFASKSERPSSGWKHVVVLLLGPAPGLLAALLLATLHPGSERLIRGSLVWEALVASAWINGLSLLPIVPFDGGYAARALFFAERLIAQTSLALTLGGFVAVFAFMAKRWDLVLGALLIVLSGMAFSGLTGLADRFRSRVGSAALGKAPPLAKDAPEPLLRALFDEWSNDKRASSIRGPRAIALLLSSTYATAVLPALSPRQRVVLGLVYAGLAVPAAFVLLDLLLGKPF